MLSNYNMFIIQHVDQKAKCTTFFLLAGKLPLDFTIMVHNLTSSGWVHLSCKKNSCMRPGEGKMSKHRLKGCLAKHQQILQYF